MDLLVLVMLLAVVPVAFAAVYLLFFTVYWTELRRAARFGTTA